VRVGCQRYTLLLVVATAAAGGCNLTVTSETPPFAALDVNEQNAVNVILRELTAFNANVKGMTKYSIDPLADREHIDVSFEGMFFVGNFGDGKVHDSTWENLTDEQRALAQTWFKSATPAAAKVTYETLFYQFLAVSQGVKQFMYNALTAQWIFANRSLFNVERDSVRTALAHYDTVGRRAEMWGFLTSACTPVISQYDSTYSAHFDKQYLQDHFVELADGKAPTGYLYFICRWVQMGKDDAEGLQRELSWLLTLAPTS
jgi:hypothetical protein